MAVSLKRILKRAGFTLDRLLTAIDDSIQIQDSSGTVLKGDIHTSITHRYPLLVNAQAVGWVAGGAKAAVIADLLMHLIDRELEVKTLANDALDKYREVNLLYNLSEKLNVSLDIAVVAQTILSEAQRLIPANDASIILFGSTRQIFTAEPASTRLLEAQSVIASLAEAGKGEIINDVAADVRLQAQSSLLAALVYVPLKIERGIIGALWVGTNIPSAYTAQHLKLLTTVASQAAQAIDNAHLHQQQLEAAKARESRLQQQLRELRLEVDEAKRSRQVAEITETDYFQQLQKRAGQLRRRRTPE